MASHVVVDGSNIATEGRSLPSLAQLDEAVRAFMAEHPSDRLTVVVDATFGHRIDKSERAAYEAAIENNEVITPPAGTTGRGDAFILEVAERAGATVLSNDSFQEFHGDHPWLFEDGRLVGGKPVPDVGWVFLPRTPVRGPASRRSTREAAKASKGDAGGGGGGGGGRSSADEPQQESKGRSRRRGGRGRGRKKDETAESGKGSSGSKEGSSGSQDRGGRKRGKDDAGSGDDGPKRPTKAEPLNEPLPFIEFVGANPVGSTVSGKVERFTSHGAHVMVGGVRCYVDLAGLGDPPPNRARDVLDKEDEHDFMVLAVDTPRRGIDLAMAGSQSAKEEGLEPTKGGRTKKASAAKAGSGSGSGGRGKGSGSRSDAEAKAKTKDEGAGAKKAKKTGKAAEGAKASKGEKADAGGTTKKKQTKKAAKSSSRGSKKKAASSGRTRGAASAPVAPDPDDPNYGTIVTPEQPKKKGLLGRITKRS